MAEERLHLLSRTNYQELDGGHRNIDHQNDLEDYFFPLMQMHHAVLHDWGVARGLEVHAHAEGTGVVVEPGVAVDALGRLIVVPTTRDVQIESQPQGQSYVLLEFHEEKRDDNETIQETARLRVQPAPELDAAADAAGIVVLAIVVVDGEGQIETVVDHHVACRFQRRLLGNRLMELEFQRSAVVDGRVQTIAVGRIGPSDSGGLSITVPHAGDIVQLASESENGHFAKLDVQAEEMHLSGTLEVAGPVNSRDIAADGKKLDSHLVDTNNPHKVTAQQTKALPISGGTLAGSLTVQGNIMTTGKVDGRDVAADGKKLDSHAADKNNPHQVTAAQVKALPLSGGTLAGPLSVKGDTEINGKLQVTGEITANRDLLLGQRVEGEVSGPEYGNKLHFLGAKWNTDPVWMARYVAERNSTSLRMNIGDDAEFAQDKFEVGSENWQGNREFRTWWYVDHDGGHTQSDVRRKTQVSTIAAGLNTVMQMRGVEFGWRDQVATKEDAPKKLGVIAQEIEAVVPSAVSTDSEGYKFVNYNALIPILIEAIKEQQAQIDQQQITLAALTGKERVRD